MKKSQALPGKYLSKDDFDPPVLAQVATVVGELIDDGDRGKKEKPVLYIMGPNRDIDVTRGIILNGTNWDAIAAITGKDDSDDWEGHQIVIFHDPNVTFGAKKIGGVRIRAPRQAVAQKKVVSRPADPAPAEPEPEFDPTEPPIADEDLPF